MGRSVSTGDRSRFDFAGVVQSAFRFLVDEFAFRISRAEPTLVRYESPSVFVNVYHGRASYELGFEVGVRPHGPSQPEERFTLGEILEAGGVRRKLNFTFLQASTPERVSRLVPEMAELVRQYAGPALRGSAAAFLRLRETQGAISDEYLKQIRLGRVREQADEAWRKKWYPVIVKLYEAIQSDLTRSESARLSYARKHMGSPSGSDDTPEDRHG